MDLGTLVFTRLSVGDPVLALGAIITVFVAFDIATKQCLSPDQDVHILPWPIAVIDGLLRKESLRFEIKTGQIVATDGYLSFREKFKREFSETGVVIYQRGYGITNAQSRRPVIATTSISPCIAVLAYRSDTQTAALAHVDAEQDFSSLEDMLDLPDFQGVANVQLHFYGGLSNFDESRNTCYGLLNAAQIDAFFRYLHREEIRSLSCD